LRSRRALRPGRVRSARRDSPRPDPRIGRPALPLEASRRVARPGRCERSGGARSGPLRVSDSLKSQRLPSSEAAVVGARTIHGFESVKTVMKTPCFALLVVFSTSAFAGTLSGRVTDGSVGIAGVDLDAYDGGNQLPITNDDTDANGFFSVAIPD